MFKVEKQNVAAAIPYFLSMGFFFVLSDENHSQSPRCTWCPPHPARGRTTTTPPRSFTYRDRLTGWRRARTTRIHRRRGFRVERKSRARGKFAPRTHTWRARVPGDDDLLSSCERANNDGRDAGERPFQRPTTVPVATSGTERNANRRRATAARQKNELRRFYRVRIRSVRPHHETATSPSRTRCEFGSDFNILIIATTLSPRSMTGTQCARIGARPLAVLSRRIEENRIESCYINAINTAKHQIIIIRAVQHSCW